jgi:hypothetical protein
MNADVLCSHCFSIQSVPNQILVSQRETKLKRKFNYNEKVMETLDMN